MEVCPICNDLDVQSRKFDKDGNIKFDLRSLKRSVQRNRCVICSALLECIHRFRLDDLALEISGVRPKVRAEAKGHITTQYGEEYWDNVKAAKLSVCITVQRDRVCMYLRGNAIFQTIREAVIYKTSGAYPCHIFEHLEQARLTPSGDSLSRWLRIEPRQHLPQFSDSTDCFDLLKSWLRECDDTHQDCVSSSAQRLPKRLIHVGGTCNEEIYLWETNGAEVNERYTTLSHCWGKTAEVKPLQTTQHTKERWSSQIPWNLLGRTFQDAITISRAIGVRFLWIDSLCIVQDDKYDWESHAVIMATIYQNSYLTIYASRSANSKAGIFSDRYLDRTHVEDGSMLEPYHLGSEDSQPKVVDLFACLSLDPILHPVAHLELTKPHLEPLHSRAWAFQGMSFNLEPETLSSNHLVKINPSTQDHK